MSRRAEDMIGWAIYAGSVIPILTLVAVVMLLKPLFVLSVLFAPLFATYQYVVYRHVFTGRRRNHEVVTATPVVDNDASQVAPIVRFGFEASDELGQYKINATVREPAAGRVLHIGEQFRVVK